MKKIGVFVCHCGVNISGTVDVEKVVQEMSNHSNVAYATHYSYMCSETGQKIITEKIVEKNLDRVVIACCSPTLHQTTFSKAVESIGINAFLCEIANIREQCSWVHKDKESATKKAIKIVNSIIEKIKLNEELLPVSVPVTRRALVIGGGIAGIQSALDIANSGYEVLLVEKEPSIGGHMIQLSETFPTLDCSQCILTPKMVEVAQHEKIKLLTYSEVEEVSGYVGNFKVKIKKKPAFVDWTKCNGCGLCQEKCPVKVTSEFDRGQGQRKAIYIPFPQAVPNKPVIDSKHCLFFTTGKCKICEKTCPIGAIKYDDEPEIIEEEIGAIVVATGYELYGMENIKEYGEGKYKDVIDGLQFERLLSASGPTNGEIKRPSDGKIPKTVAFISCVGSRDPEHHFPYCSQICCRYNVKHAMLYKHRVPDGEAIVFYIDIRTVGKYHEEFIVRAREEDKVLYIRSKVSRIIENNGNLILRGVDTLTGNLYEMKADMVVLSMAIVPSPGIQELARKLHIQVDEYGFLSEAHIKLRPVESLTSGFFLAGAAQTPKDIPTAIAQASSASAKVGVFFSQKELLLPPIVAVVCEELCSGCGICTGLCPYNAREMIMQDDKKIAKVNEILCEGCGSCISGCPTSASQQRNLKDEQLYRMIDVVIQ